MNKMNICLMVLGMVVAPNCFAKKSDSQDSFADLLSRRHSGYAYDSSRPVTQDQMKELAKAAQSAPSSYNDQPWFFIMCDRASQPEAYGKVMSSLVEFNQQWAKAAPVLVVVAAHKNSHKGEANRWAHYDSGAAAVCMVLKAASMGLMAHQMGGFDPEKISTLFDLPKDVEPMSVMAIGYEAAGETKNAAKDRKPLHENFFAGAWAKGLGN